MIKVHSPTIEELVMDGWLGKLDILAPALKQFRLEAILENCFTVSFSAPMVEDLSWSCSFNNRSVGIGEQSLWCVRRLSLQTKESARVLRMDIHFAFMGYSMDIDLFQRIAPFPEFSVLEMYLESNGHVFGAMMLDLLGTCSSILRLKLIMQSSRRTDECSPDCLCDESPNWRSQTIPLMSLEEIEIDGFLGTSHEVDFLKLLFRSATLMKTMIVRLSCNLLTSNRGYKEMLRIFAANPSVQCYVYHRSW